MDNDGFDNPVPTPDAYVRKAAAARRTELIATAARLAEHRPAAEALLAPFLARIETGDEAMWGQPLTRAFVADRGVATLADGFLQLAGWRTMVSEFMRNGEDALVVVVERPVVP